MSRSMKPSFAHIGLWEVRRQIEEGRALHWDIAEIVESIGKPLCSGRMSRCGLPNFVDDPDSDERYADLQRPEVTIIIARNFIEDPPHRPRIRLTLLVVHERGICLMAKYKVPVLMQDYEACRCKEQIVSQAVLRRGIGR